MKVLITGANGFIGKNLDVQLSRREGFEILRYTRESTIDELRQAVANADFICHMAGSNRPTDISEFARDNTDFTRDLCEILRQSERPVPIIFASSMHAENDVHNEENNQLSALYGASKKAAEHVLLQHSEETGVPVYIFRLPHVIGKWCRPNYNSVVATFCYNIARDLPIQIVAPNYQLKLVYIDDLVSHFVQIMLGEGTFNSYCEVQPIYPITVGALADQILAFQDCRSDWLSERVGSGLTRALYATYISYLPAEKFSYALQEHSDPRGIFVEILKTKDSGQFSFFTAHPGVTRGGHYHHSKVEKFLVLKGHARFRFKHILTDECYELNIVGDEPKIVETIPGWAHDITNIGEDEMIVVLWANEIFDKNTPDTYAYSV